MEAAGLACSKGGEAGESSGGRDWAASRALFETEAFRAVAGLALRPGGTELTQSALDRCPIPAGSRVADVGCGRGATLALLAGRGFSAVGLDPGPELLAEARDLSEHAGLAGTGRLIRGVAEAIPLASGSMAAVTCECVLSVSRHKALALTEMRRILAPGGILILSDLYRRGPSRASCGPPGCAAGAVPRCEVEALLADAGFRIHVFEDHSRLLAELTGRLIFAGFPARSLSAGCSESGRPGYYLCIAHAEE